MTKQVGLGLVVPALLFRLLSAPRSSLWTLLPFAGLVLAAFATLEITSHGWFWFYAVEVPASHQLYLQHWRTDLADHLVDRMLLMATCALAVAVRGVPPGDGACGCFTWCGFSWRWERRSRHSRTRAAMTTMPAHAALALSARIVFAHLRRGAIPSFGLNASSVGRVAFAVGTLWLQLALLNRVDVNALVPTDLDAEGTRQLLAAAGDSCPPTSSTRSIVTIACESSSSRRRIVSRGRRSAPRFDPITCGSPILRRPSRTEPAGRRQAAGGGAWARRPGPAR